MWKANTICQYFLNLDVLFILFISAIESFLLFGTILWDFVPLVLEILPSRVLFKTHRVHLHEAILTIDLKRQLYIDDILDICERVDRHAWRPYESLCMTRLFENMNRVLTL